MRVSPRSFTVFYCLTYCTVFFLNRPLFLYYPIPKRFSWGWAPLSGVGPAMAWYGLMAYAAIAALVLAVIVPDRALGRLARDYLWVIPVATMGLSLFLLRKLFF